MRKRSKVVEVGDNACEFAMSVAMSKGLHGQVDRAYRRWLVRRGLSDMQFKFGNQKQQEKNNEQEART